MRFHSVAVRTFRKRYIVFKTSRWMSRRQVIELINRRGAIHHIKLKLTVFEGNKGIVLVPHFLKEKAIKAMNFEEDGISVKTIKTSGTIKKAKKTMHQL